MSYESVARDVVRVIEGVGGSIMVAGGLVAFARYAQQILAGASDPFREPRSNLGRVLLLGLEVLISPDSVRTMLTDQSLKSGGVRGRIGAKRIRLRVEREGGSAGASAGPPQTRLAVGVGTGLADADIVNNIFLATLARPPSAAEVAAILSRKQSNRLLWLTGVQWALLQKRDFVFNY